MVINIHNTTGQLLKDIESKVKKDTGINRLSYDQIINILINKFNEGSK